MTLPLNCGEFEDVLPDLLDDTTAPAAMTHAVRAHLDSCAACRSLYEDLNGIRATAAALPRLVPSRDLWAGIAARIEAPVLPLVEGATTARRPRRQISWRAAGIAAALLLVANMAVSYGLLRRGEPSAVSGVDTYEMPEPTYTRASLPAATMLVPIPVPSTVRQGAPQRPTFVLATNDDDGQQGSDQQPSRRREAARMVYDREIARLVSVVDSGRHKLDPAAMAILDRNLRIIDSAIEQCNDALTRDSTSTFLIESLNNAYQTKVKLLRIAAAAASRG